MIYLLELESLVERYTSWWVDYIPKKLRSLGANVERVMGSTLTDTVNTGTVLDASSTNYFKSIQLSTICKKFHNDEIKPGDHFLVANIWYPGIEMIPYMAQLYKIPINIWGVWHTGSSTHNDFAEPMHHWSKYFESGFLNVCNGVFVGSEYSRESIITRLLYYLPKEEVDSIAKRIYSIGMPLDYTNLQQYIGEKKKRIIFPHRPDIEKNPHIFLSLLPELKKLIDEENYEIVFCTSKKEYKSQDSWINNLFDFVMDHYNNKYNHPIKILENLSKVDYYKLVAESEIMISATSEENFGYCAVEALALGTQVLLPNAFSHPEIVENDSRLLYNNWDELTTKIFELIKTPVSRKELQNYAKPYEYVVQEWAKIMKE